jgi:CRP/FNR family transcriptional activator FtrB
MTMREDDYNAIRDLDLFHEMSGDRFYTLLAGSVFRYIPPDVQLATQGDPANFLHVLAEGRGELFARANGKDCTIAIVEPNATLLCESVIKNAVYLMSARTIEPSRVLTIPSEDVRAAFVTDPNFALSMAAELAARIQVLANALKNQRLRTGTERLANYLLNLHNAQGGTGTAKLVIGKGVLASLLGMSPENLSRAFTALRGYGVEVKASEIKLNKLKDLEMLAKPVPLIDGPAV